MKVLVNGDEQTIDDSWTVAELLRSLGLHDRRCATVLNGSILRRPDRETTPLREGDSLDIVSMVGGG